MGRFLGSLRSWPLGRSHGRDRLRGGRAVWGLNCTCNAISVCPNCLNTYYKALNAQDSALKPTIEDLKRRMDESPMVPTHLNQVNYGLLPSHVIDVLEHSGVVGYLTGGEGGAQSLNDLVTTCIRAVNVDGVTRRVAADLFIRSMCAGWARIGLDEVQTNSVASTADEYYKGLFAARQKEKDLFAPNITSTGMAGFQEQGPAQDWDFAIGVVKGFRKWSVIPSGADAAIFQGSYSKDFLGHTMLEDGRRKAVCHNASSGHPKDDVPADTGCGCGWWAYWSPQEAAKHNGGGGSGSIQVTVSVEGSGRVVIGQKGFRCQYVRVTGIAPYQPEVVDPGVIEQLKQFSRANLLDAPVYANEEVLQDEVGVDPVYGTLTARYPELSDHSNRELAAYVWFLTSLSYLLSGFLNELGHRIDGNRLNRLDVYGNRYESGLPNYNPNDGPEQAQHGYLKTCAELLENEKKVISRIINEREPAGWDKLVNDLRDEDRNSRIVPGYGDFLKSLEPPKDE